MKIEVPQPTTETQKYAAQHGKLPVIIWKVESESHPGRFHNVKLYSDGRVECDCIGFGTHHTTCRHIKKVQRSLDPNNDLIS